MRQARWAAIIAALFVVACVATVHPHVYYLTQPAHVYTDATTDTAIVHIEDRTVMWMGGVMQTARWEDQEQGACLHVAAMRQDSTWVDSIDFAPRDLRHPDKYHIAFSCQRGWLRVHWHIPYYGRVICEPSENDRNPYYAGVNVLMCGHGIDSIVAYRVRR